MISAVCKVNAGDRQRNAEVDHQPWICFITGMRAAVVVYVSVATAVDGVAGAEPAKNAGLSGRHVGRHVTHLVRFR